MDDGNGLCNCTIALAEHGQGPWMTVTDCVTARTWTRTMDDGNGLCNCTIALAEHGQGPWMTVTDCVTAP